MGEFETSAKLCFRTPFGARATANAPDGADCRVAAWGMQSAGVPFCGSAEICKGSAALAHSIELTSAFRGIAFPGRTRTNETENRNLEPYPQTAGKLIASPSTAPQTLTPPSPPHR